MAYDEDLANRIRELIASEDGLSEKRMFGGLSFLLDGHMSVAVSSRGGILVRVGTKGAAQALSRPHASEVAMGGRTMTGWVRVAPEGLASKRQLAAWVARGVQLARSLPPKG